MSIMRRRRNPSFKVPNRLIPDGSLSFSARRMGTVLFRRRNHPGACRRSQASQAKLAGCSVTTARKALLELEDAGYITRSQNHRYNKTLGRLVYQYTYPCEVWFYGGFTQVPWNLAGNKSRAFPSLNLICKDFGIGKARLVPYPLSGRAVVFAAQPLPGYSRQLVRKDARSFRVTRVWARTYSSTEWN